MLVIEIASGVFLGGFLLWLVVRDSVKKILNTHREKIDEIITSHITGKTDTFLVRRFGETDMEWENRIDPRIKSSLKSSIEPIRTTANSSR